MPHDDRLTSDALLKALAALASAGHERASSAQLVEATGSSLPAVKRMLSRLVAEKRVEVTGKARATRYRRAGKRMRLSRLERLRPARPSEAARRPRGSALA